MDLARTPDGARLRVKPPGGVRLWRVLRLLLLGAAVFTVAAMVGALLAAAAPTGGGQSGSGGGPARTAGAAALPGTSSASTATGPALQPPAPTDHDFARSMVYSGATALTVSVVGLVLVGRRRRHW